MADNNCIEESWRFVKQVAKGRWFSVFASFLIMIGCGSTYLFGTYSKLLKTQFDYNQTQVNTLAFAKDLGSNTGVFAGLLAEVVPPWVLFLVGSSSNFLSYFMIWLSVSGYIPKPYFWVMFIFICMSANSQNFSNTAVMVTSIRNFPDRGGAILGLLKGFVGLGGAVLTQFYLAIYGHQNPANLVLLLCWLPSIVSLLFFLTIRKIHAPKQPKELKVFYQLLFLSIILAGFNLLLTITQKHTVFSQLSYVRGVAVIVALLCVPLLIAIKEEFFLFKLNKLHITQVPSIVTVSIPNEKSEEILETSPCFSNICNKPKRGEDFSILQALLSKDMALVFIATVSACGSSVAAIDNFGQIVESLGYPIQSISIFVSWISILNFFGRVISGFISETLITKYKLPRPLMFALTHLLTFTGLLFIAFPSYKGSVYAAALIIGFSFGAQVPLLFTIISDLFGLKHYSTLLNCGQLAVPFGSYILNVHVIGKFYDREATKNGNVNNGEGLTCMGPHCFSKSFTILATVTLFGTMASFVLAYRTRDFYKGDIYKKYRDDMWITQSDVNFSSNNNKNHEHRKSIDDESRQEKQ